MMIGAVWGIKYEIDDSLIEEALSLGIDVVKEVHDTLREVSEKISSHDNNIIHGNNNTEEKLTFGFEQ